MAMPTLLQLTFLVIISFLGKFPQTNLTSIFAVDTNLIQLDTDDLATNTNTYADNDDDLIFEVKFSPSETGLSWGRGVFPLQSECSEKYEIFSVFPAGSGRREMIDVWRENLIIIFFLFLGFRETAAKRRDRGINFLLNEIFYHLGTLL